MNMRILCATATAIFALGAGATEKPSVPVPTNAQQQSQMQSQNQQQAQQQNAMGGTAANQFSAKETVIGLATTAPAPLHATPACYLPAKGIRRVRQALFGVVTLDSRLVRDESCMDDLKIAREYELAKLEAETQLERARAERITAESSCARCVAK